MQSLEDVLQKAFEGADPMEIEQMLRARGDYRPHPVRFPLMMRPNLEASRTVLTAGWLLCLQEFGKNLSIPWSAGTRETPKFDVAGAICF